MFLAKTIYLNLISSLQVLFRTIRENRTEIEHLTNLQDILLAKLSD